MSLFFFLPLTSLNNSSEPNTSLEIFLRPHVGSSLFYIDPTHVILSRIDAKYHKSEITIQPFFYIKEQDSCAINTA